MSSNTTHGWTDEREAAAKKMWLEGSSASLIAKALGGATRNAVIGKLNRLGLTGKPPQKTAIRQPVRLAPSAPARLAAVEAPTPKAAAAQPAPERQPGPVRPIRYPEEPAPMRELVRPLNLKSSHCRWPFGVPGADDFAHCGAKRVGKLPYCAEHARRAYIPVPKAKNEAATLKRIEARANRAAAIR